MIFTIFKKELKETLRDKKTIMSMIIIPMLIFPVIFTVLFKVEEFMKKSMMDKPVKIGVIGSSEIGDYLSVLKSLPEEMGKTTIIHFTDSSSLKAQIQADSLQFGLLFPQDYAENAQTFKTSKIKVLFKASEIGASDKAEVLNNAVASVFQAKRYEELSLDQQKVTPIAFDYVNIASDQETIGNLVGGFLPYIFIVFGFVGCMYPCIDLFTGEKERGTFETLLTTPVTRWQIMLGKMGVVVMSGFLAAVFTIVGIFLSLNVFGVIKDPRIIEAVLQMFNGRSLVMLMLLLLPLIIVFAGVMIPIAVNAKTFKEAQSIITPLNMVFIMVAVIGMIPGFNLTVLTACIPVVNVVLGMKSLLSGYLEWYLLAITFVVMVAFATLAVVISYRKFDDERNIVL